MKKTNEAVVEYKDHFKEQIARAENGDEYMKKMFGETTTKTFSMKVPTFMKLNYLSTVTGVSKSEIVANLIDQYYDLQKGEE